MPHDVSRDGVRVRFNAIDEAELNVEDLRASGDQRLERLAEADKSKSSSMYTVGNDDGWLALSEVDGASGIHTSIHGGYWAVLDVANERRVESLPMTDVQRFMTKGGTGPIRLRNPPPVPPPKPPDPILRPNNYDTTSNPKATSPRLLDEHEQAIDDAYGSSAERVTVSRGFSLEGYGPADLVRYLAGDWRGLIASHTFSQKLRDALKNGTEFHDALITTAAELRTQIVDEVAMDGVDAFMIRNSRATQIGIRNKSATAMATYPGTFADREAMLPASPFAYARTGFNSLVGERIRPSNQPMIVIEVDQKSVPENGKQEYYIASHVPPTKIERFYLGFSNWYEVKNFLTPPEREESWFEFSILERDDEGRPTVYEIAPMMSDLRGHSETWTRGEERWRSDRADDNNDAFETKYPILADAIAAITS